MVAAPPQAGGTEREARRWQRPSCSRQDQPGLGPPPHRARRARPGQPGTAAVLSLRFPCEFTFSAGSVYKIQKTIGKTSYRRDGQGRPGAARGPGRRRAEPRQKDRPLAWHGQRQHGPAGPLLSQPRGSCLSLWAPPAAGQAQRALGGDRSGTEIAPGPHVSARSQPASSSPCTWHGQVTLHSKLASPSPSRECAKGASAFA